MPNYDTRCDYCSIDMLFLLHVSEGCGKCLSTRGGGWGGGGGGGPHSQVLSQVSGPRSFLEGTSVPDGGGGGYPSPGQGVPQNRYTPQPGLGYSWAGLGYPLARTGVALRQDWGSPPPPCQNRLCCGWYASCPFPAGGLSCCTKKPSPREFKV